MKKLLTIRIISALNHEKQQLVYARLKLEKRKTLFHLYKIILRQIATNTVDKQLLFQHVFKKKWTTENDYLLRHELKLLKDKIEDICIQEQAKKMTESIKNQLKLELYKQLKVTDEYHTLFKLITKHNSLNFELFNTLENSFEFSDFVRLNIPNYAQRLTLMQKNEALFEDTLMQLVSQQYSKLCLMKSHVLLQQKQLNNQKVTTIFDYDILQIDTRNYRNALTDYHIAYANAYKNYDTSTIEQWEEVYSLLQNIESKNTYILKEYCFTLGNLATICSIRNQFEKADFYFSELFNSLPEAITSQNMALTLNYITNLNKLKFHEMARVKMQNAVVVFGNKIKSFSQFRTQQIVAACYLANTNELGSLLAIDFETLQPFERIFYRLFYCIYFIQIEDFELAFTEILNLQRSKLMKEIDTHYELIADYFYVCIKHGLSVSGNYTKCSNKAMKEIESANEKIIQSGVPILQNYSPYQWMREKVNS